jgi:hypothetical protein
VIATIDGEPAGEMLTTYGDLDLGPQWRVGAGVLGIVSYRNLQVHSAECVPVPGEPSND